jgi:hypothetical protein
MRNSRITISIGTAAAALVVAGMVGGYHASAQEGDLPSGLAADLGEQLGASLSQDSPFETDLPDHLWLVADDESAVFIHLDKPAPEATRVIYMGYGVKGRWCAEDQEQIESVAGEGFTHFHRTAEVATPDAGHGGSEPGEPGYWLKHVAVGPAFEMPWGTVEPGMTDQKFMPTAAPKCGS